MEVIVKDARPTRKEFSLDTSGFCLVDDHSNVSDWNDRSQLEGLYTSETEQLVKKITGADEVVVFEPTLRRVATTKEWQPFGSEVHVDYTAQTAEGLIANLLEKKGLDPRSFSRFQCINVWRALSPAPQDHPLGMCDARSVSIGECRPNYRIKVDALPDPDNLPSGEPDPTPAADMFEYRPYHRWWFFSDMTPEEGLVFKLYDSEDPGRRCPHTAFEDALRDGAVPRESIEIRTIVCYK
ncbi:hypothetical protein LARI1_G000777 [Lachnellula arida]|uniref:Hydroxylase/desaturase asaB n=1 Tax=Lachnellula arida TaxID=1316785 RepID=A0A8T9BIB4_9HELO|nr:hypothetical protein LARI1_G000777 [Lachnellula arida]